MEATRRVGLRQRNSGNGGPPGRMVLPRERIHARKRRERAPSLRGLLAEEVQLLVLYPGNSRKHVTLAWMVTEEEGNWGFGGQDQNGSDGSQFEGDRARGEAVLGQSEGDGTQPVLSVEGHWRHLPGSERLGTGRGALGTVGVLTWC